jgi:pilus assembly protein Flp/PilA
MGSLGMKARPHRSFVVNAQMLTTACVVFAYWSSTAADTVHRQFPSIGLRRRNQEDGATAVEYALMVSLIAIVIIVAVKLLGTNLSTLFNKTATSV